VALDVAAEAKTPILMWLWQATQQDIMRRD
jgi:hypothetical protein